MIAHCYWLSVLVAWVMVMVNGYTPPTCPASGSICYYQGKVATLRLPPSGSYYLLGGLFNIHKQGTNGNAIDCGTEFNPTGILHTQAFLFSVDYWKQQLPKGSQVGISAVVFDSCGRTEQMIQNILGFAQCNVRIENMDRHNLVGFIGPDENADAIAAASLTESLDLTVISPSANSQQLYNNSKYHYFLRTAPSVAVDIDIFTKVLLKVGTKYVAAIYEEKETSSFTEFAGRMKSLNICVTDSYSMTGQESNDALDNFVKGTLVTLETVRYIALFTSQSFVERFIIRLDNNKDVRAKPFVFLMTSAVRKSSQIFTTYAVAAEDAILLERLEPNSGSITTAVQAFKTYWNNSTIRAALGNNSFLADSFLADFLAAGHSLPPYDVDVANTIMATEAFIKGVYQAGVSTCGLQTNPAGDYLCTNFFNPNGRGSAINNYIRNTTNYFETNSNNLNPQQIPYAIYTYKNTLQKVGDYISGTYTTTTVGDLGSMVQYTAGRCQVSPCIKCNEFPVTTTTPPSTTSAAPTKGTDDNGNYSVVYYPANQQITGAYMTVSRKDSEFATRFEVGQRWIIALGVLAGLGILAVFIFEIYILYKLLGTQMGQKWRTMWLGQLLLFGIFLCYLTLFAYLPIPTKATCGITRFGVGVSYSICFGVLLVKLMVILTSKSSENSLIASDMESPNYLKGIYQFLMFVFVVGVQVVIDTQWLITVPPEAVKVTSNSGQQVWVCNHYTFQASATVTSMTDMASFVRNEFENHILSLVYIMFLILITTILSLNAHGIITNHRESIFIGIAAGFSIPVWIAWTLVGGLNRSHGYAHEFGDGCIAFGLFLTATLILFSMFLPKVRQLVNMGVEGIYYEDDRETYYAGSVIMAPSYKSHPNSVIYVNNQGIYSEPMALGNGDSGSNYPRHSGYGNAAGSVYSAPPATYVKRGADSTRGGSVLRVTDDLSGKRPLEKKRPMSEAAYGTASKPRSMRGTLPRSRSQTNLGAL